MYIIYKAMMIIYFSFLCVLGSVRENFTGRGKWIFKEKVMMMMINLFCSHFVG